MRSFWNPLTGWKRVSISGSRRYTLRTPMYGCLAMSAMVLSTAARKRNALSIVAFTIRYSA